MSAFIRAGMLACKVLLRLRSTAAPAKIYSAGPTRALVSDQSTEASHSKKSDQDANERLTRYVQMSSTAFAFRGRAAPASLIALLFCLAPLNSQAQFSTHLTYDEQIRRSTTFSALDENLFGDKANLQEGSLSFVQDDVVLNTNSQLKVLFGRKTPLAKQGLDEAFAIFGIDWEPNVPFMMGTYDTRDGWNSSGSLNRCSNGFVPLEHMGPYPYYYTRVIKAHMWWQGININIPGQGEEKLLKVNSGVVLPTDDKTYYGTTKSSWKVSCLDSIKNGAGQGFAVTLPDGTTYYFDWMATRNAVDLTANGNVDPDTGDSDDPFYLLAPLTDHYLYATKAVDRFGNTITYTYDQAHPNRIVSIESNDWVRLDIAYNSTGQVSTVTSEGRTWTYGYVADINGYRRLSSITLPDLSKWEFGYQRRTGFLLEEHAFWTNGCNMNPGPMKSTVTPDPSVVTTISMKHPSGARGEFKLRPLYHGTNMTPGGCDGNSTFFTYGVPAAYVVNSLFSKRIHGTGMSDRSWQYMYYPSWSFDPTQPDPGVAGNCGNPCPETSQTTVTNNGILRRYTFGNSFFKNAGQLLSETVEQSGQVRQLKTYNYLISASGQLFGNNVGDIPMGSCATYDSEDPHCELYGNPLHFLNRPLRVVSTQLDGATFTRTVNTFDRFVRPTKTTKSSSLGYSKTEAIGYHDNLTKWVLGQVSLLKCMSSSPTSTSCNGAGDESLRVDYDDNAMPWQVKRFDRVQQTLTYYNNGVLASVSDGRDSEAFDTTIRFPNVLPSLEQNWKRGIPQSILFPATPDHPEGTKLRRFVNDSGWITTSDDENGYRTCYTYDGMGRVTSITYPSEDPYQCNTSRWNATTISFRNTDPNGNPYPGAGGLPAGHWRQVVQTGNNKRVILFDPLWRPVIEQSYDSTNVDATLSEVAKRYDTGGRLAFQSYPASRIEDFNLATAGTYTYYDALNRATLVRQTSERGNLDTSTAYLAGFKTRVTLPKHQGPNPTVFTDTSYMAWDEPTAAFPVAITHPEGAYTDIVRDPLGKPTSLTRRNAIDSSNPVAETRTFAYNVHHELCRMVEPETGATLYDYDDAGNLWWSAAGLPAGAACEPDGPSPATQARLVERLYDNRNRLIELSFSDGRGDQTWEYTKDGLPEKVHTVNVVGANNIDNFYLYNSRRLLEAETQLLPEWYTYRLDYGYDKNGNLKTLQYPSGRTVDFAPNPLGQATQVKDLASGGAEYAKEITYHPNGDIAKFKYGNGFVYSMTQYDDLLPEIVKTEKANAANPAEPIRIIDQTYHYDKNGNVTTLADNLRGASGHRWTYFDNLDRLTHVGFAQLGGNHHMYFTYDVLDNLQTWKHPDGGGVEMVRDSLYCYDASNRLEYVRSEATTCSNGGSADYFQYDLQGNVKRHDNVTFDFDFGNRLREVTGVERYRYDAYGRRMLAMNFITGTLYSQYGQNGQLLYQENSRTGQEKQIDHIYLAGSLIAQREVSTPSGAVTVKYHHTDALGSPVAVTNASGGLLEQMDYAPYGKQLDASTTVGRDRPGYTGHVRDLATGLNYMQQRYYNSEIGRFLSVDPVTANGNTGANFNRYWYASNNPYTFTDPDGRYVCVAGESKCDRMDKAAKQIHQAAEKAASNSRVAQVSRFIGKPGERNGVVISGRVQDSENLGEHSAIDGGGTLIALNFDALSSTDEISETAMHEGSHGVDQNDPTVSEEIQRLSKSALNASELRANTASARLFEILGRDHPFRLYNKAGGINWDAINEQSDRSVEKICGAPNSCNP